MTYQVAAWHGDRPDAALEALWRDSLAITGDLPDRYRWAYRENPAGRGAVFGLFDDDLMVGCAGLLPRRFRSVGATLDAAMYGDFAVSAAHRTLSPALALQREAGRHVDRACHFGYGFPNQASCGVFRRLGHVQVGVMTRYARVLRLAPHLASTSGAVRWCAGPGALADRARLALVSLRRRTAPSLQWENAPDGRFDDLFRVASRQFPLIGSRDRQALTWRFFARQDAGNLLATLSAGAGGRLRGYAVVAPRVGHSGRPFAEVKDFLAASEADLGDLLRYLCEDLALRGFATCSVRFLGASCVASRLHSAGFERRGEGNPLLVQPSETRGGLPGYLLDRESWYLTDADEDW